MSVVTERDLPWLARLADLEDALDRLDETFVLDGFEHRRTGERRSVPESAYRGTFGEWGNAHADGHRLTSLTGTSASEG